MTDDERGMEAVRRVTVELANILAPFWDHIAITGGLAAYLLVPQHDAVHKHRGTTDVDLIGVRACERALARVGPAVNDKLYAAFPSRAADRANTMRRT